MGLNFKATTALSRRGFTLAEVLITLGVIGIVAAMTIPTLMNQTSEKETVTKVKKVYSTLSNAATLVRLDEGNDLSGLISDGTTGDDVLTKFSKHLKLLKNCGTTYEECWYNINNQKCLDASEATSYSGAVGGGDYTASDYASGILTDGTLIYFSKAFNQFNVNDSDIPGGRMMVVIGIDINGKKPPNQYGADVFRFYLNRNGVFPYGHWYSESILNGEGEMAFGCSSQTAGYTCSTRILREDAINYKRALESSS